MQQAIARSFDENMHNECLNNVSILLLFIVLHKCTQTYINHDQKNLHSQKESLSQIRRMSPIRDHFGNRHNTFISMSSVLLFQYAMEYVHRIILIIFEYVLPLWFENNIIKGSIFNSFSSKYQIKFMWFTIILRL